jgi:hypothetical protein
MITYYVLRERVLSESSHSRRWISECHVGVPSRELMGCLYLIPASRAPLGRVFVGGKDVLLAYANGKARVWNVETMEFRRSTGIDAADEMLQTGGWSEV